MQQHTLRKQSGKAVQTALLLMALGHLPVPLIPQALAADQARSALASYQIRSASLEQALSQFASQAGISITLPPALVDGKTSSALSGDYTVQQGLEILLTGTGLQVVETSKGVYFLQKSLPVTKGQADLQTMKEVAVVGHHEQEAEIASGPVKGYVAKRSATATKTDTPIIETPQSITVVTADQIVAQKSQSIVDALAYTAGVAVRESGRVTESFVLRGFQADGQRGSLYKDGTKYTSNIYRGQQEPYGLERIELLRGAASVLYGNAAPGGIINTVTKRPTIDPLHELNVELGSFDRKQISGDFSDRLTEDGVWSYRLTGLFRDSDTFVDHIPDDRTFIAPAIKWQPSDATSLTILSQYKKTESKYMYGLSSYGTVKPSVNGKLSRSRFYGEPGADRYEDETWSLGYLLEHAFSDQLKLRQNVRYDEAKTNYDYTYNYGLDTATQRITDRGFDKSTNHDKAITADTNLSFNWGSDFARHTTLVGFDYTRQKEDTKRYDLTLSPYDIFNPSYGEVPANQTLNAFATNRSLQRSGLYVQDQIKIADKWVALLGGRQDWTESGSAFITGDRSWIYEKNNAFTSRAGLVYLAENGLAPFVSFSQSFEPAAGRGRTGNRFKPTEGEQYEVGIRYQPKDSNTLLSATVYQLKQQNVLTLDPVSIAFQVQTGEQRSRGIELEAKTDVTDDLTILAAYAYTDAITTKSNIATEVGARNPFTPEHQASLWADYSLSHWGVPGLKVGGGVRYVGASNGFAFLDVKVPSYTIFDAMASYTTGPWKLSVNATNLTDKTYVANCTYGCFYGQARNMIGTLTYRW
jgi:iron complex outermembrane recepter protein